MAAVAAAIAIAALAALSLRELTWRRRAAALRAKLADMRVELRDHEQRTHVDQVVSGLAQELKSPLQGVLGNTELMLASGTLGAASTDDLREIQEQATRAAGIVRNLLAFTETSALLRRWQDVNAVVSRAVGSVRADMDAAGISVEVVVADRLPLLYVDGRQLEKVIATLLVRPLGAPPRDRATDTIAVATRLGGSAERIVIEIDDRAPDADEPLWSGDLAAARQIVYAHGGTLEVERAPVGGFRFHLELPVAAVAASQPAAT